MEQVPDSGVSSSGVLSPSYLSALVLGTTVQSSGLWSSFSNHRSSGGALSHVMAGQQYNRPLLGFDPSLTTAAIGDSVPGAGCTWLSSPTHTSPGSATCRPVEPSVVLPGVSSKETQDFSALEQLMLSGNWHACDSVTQLFTTTSAVSSVSPPSTASGSSTNVHKAGPASNSNSEEQRRSHDRSAIEEEKRRRNTAASARFRMKKKLREKELEQSLNALIKQLEDTKGRIRELETENKWLKELLLEKKTLLVSDVNEDDGLSREVPSAPKRLRSADDWD